MKKKLIPIMLSVIFILSSFMTITALAASPVSQDGVTAKAGSLTQNAFTLATGESKTSTPTIVKAVTITPSKDNNTVRPQTGDSSNMIIWLSIMLISAGALVFLVIKNKKIKSKGVLSLFLSFAILGTIGFPMTANAASTQKSFTANEGYQVKEVHYE